MYKVEVEKGNLSFSAAAGLKSGKSNRKRNFGNVVSYKGLTKK